MNPKELTHVYGSGRKQMEKLSFPSVRVNGNGTESSGNRMGNGIGRPGMGS